MSVRARIFGMAMVGLARSKRSFRTIQDGPFHVAGLFRSTAGIGHAARLTLQGMREAGLMAGAVDLTSRFHPEEGLAVELGTVPNHQGAGGTLVIQLNPPETSVAIARMRRAFLRHKRIVGYWAWELPHIPRWWIPTTHLMDEIWVPSRFVADSIRPYTSTSVRVVPHPVRCHPASSLGRDAFGIPSGSLVFLCAFDVRSSLARKNPLAAIQAFSKAFGVRRDVVLILKLTGTHASPTHVERLRNTISAMENIRVIQDSLEAADMASLLRHTDVVISLHRSEGFGLLLAEAMLQGKPVVATGWSGNLQFMDRENSFLVNYRLVPVRDEQNIYQCKDQLWADPDVEEAAALLVKLSERPQLRNQVGHTARIHAERVFSSEAFRSNIDAAPARS